MTDTGASTGGDMNNSRTNEPKIDGEEIVQGIIEWVELESPSHERDAVNKMADKVADQCRAVGLEVERTPGEDGWGDLIRARGAGQREGEPGILVLSHIDTVHPIGTKEGDNKLRREGDKLYGPGTYDMKAGAYMAFYAYKHLVRLGEKPNLPVTFMFIPEEEVGSPYTRKHTEAEAAKAKYVLVTEPARDGGKVVVARKGVAGFTMKATGQPAHAGAKHEDGRSAIKEIARQILDIEALTDYERGVTLNVGLINGGTGVNVVPRECFIKIDMRVVSAEDGVEFEQKIHALTPYDPDVSLEIGGGMSHPPYPMNEKIEALFETARAASLEHGLDLQYTNLTGGGSDGNFTGAMGVPTLDGMGADGAGAHTLFEHILVSSLAPRAQTWVKLLQRLT
jgi:glutamate carboxypeptidase